MFPLGPGCHDSTWPTCQHSALHHLPPMPACNPPVTCRGCCCCARSLNTSSIEPSSTESVKPALFFLCQNPQVSFFHLAFLSWRCWSPDPISSFLQPALVPVAFVGFQGEKSKQQQRWAATWQQPSECRTCRAAHLECFLQRGESISRRRGRALCSARPVSQHPALSPAFFSSAVLLPSELLQSLWCHPKQGSSQQCSARS